MSSCDLPGGSWICDKSRNGLKNLVVPAFVGATSLRLRFRHPFIEFPSSEEVALFPEVRKVVVDFLAAEAGKAKKHWPKLIGRAYPELKDDQLDDMLVKLVVRCYCIRAHLHEAKPAGMHDCIEFCAGEGNLTLECRLAHTIIAFMV